jgi:hypothetical protein
MFLRTYLIVWLRVPEEISRLVAAHAEVRQSRDAMVFQIEELQQRVSDHRRQLDDMKTQAKYAGRFDGLIDG